MLMEKNEPIQPLQYRPKEAAKLLRMSERKLFDLCKNGDIPTAKIGGCVFIAHEVLQQWIRKMHGIT